MIMISMYVYPGLQCELGKRRESSATWAWGFEAAVVGDFTHYSYLCDDVLGDYTHYFYLMMIVGDYSFHYSYLGDYIVGETIHDYSYFLMILGYYTNYSYLIMILGDFIHHYVFMMWNGHDFVDQWSWLDDNFVVVVAVAKQTNITRLWNGKTFHRFFSLQGLQTPAKKRVQLEFSPQLMSLNEKSQDTKNWNQNLNENYVDKFGIFSNLLNNK